MTTPKSPEAIMKEFCDGNGRLEESKQWLRSSMSSLLCYMAERMHKKQMIPSEFAKMCEGDEDLQCASPEVQAMIRNFALDDCRTLLIEEARRISEV